MAPLQVYMVNDCVLNFTKSPTISVIQPNPYYDHSPNAKWFS